jgi:GTP cyclohydrolase IA
MTARDNTREQWCNESEDAYRALLTACGEDLERDGLLDTPDRAAKAWRELTSGYSLDPAELLKTFDNTDGTQDLIAVTRIPFYSLCEHHLLPFHGEAHVVYVPTDRIAGLSKFARVVYAYARRLQVQERLTDQIAALLDDKLKPQGVMVVIEAEHLCMGMRGVRAPGSVTVTSALRGVFREQGDARAEALALIGRS